MTGTTWVEESGFLEGPFLVTNTHSVGVVRDAAIAWRVRQASADASGYWWSLPVVAETWDGFLNDINGFHVKPEHIFRALSSAAGGPVAEGSVGGGTGMICYEFKGDIFLVFSTANPGTWTAKKPAAVTMVPNDDMNPLFEATVQATEEAIVNAMVAAETMTGADGHRADGLPHERLREVLKKYGRLAR